MRCRGAAEADGKQLQEQLRLLRRQLEEASGSREGLQGMVTAQADELGTVKVGKLDACSSEDLGLHWQMSIAGFS